MLVAESTEPVLRIRLLRSMMDPELKALSHRKE